MKCYKHLLKKVKKYGEISFSLDGNELSKVDIITKESIDKINLLSIAKNTYYSWLNLLRD